MQSLHQIMFDYGDGSRVPLADKILNWFLFSIAGAATIAVIALVVLLVYVVFVEIC